MQNTKTGGGPRTDEGKAVTALNATKHGVMCLSVPPAEQGAYADHLAGVTASLAPVGYLEERLTERVALTLWRMRRLDVWEAVMIERSRDQAARHLACSTFGDRVAPFDFPAHLLDAGELRTAIALTKIDAEQGRAENPEAMKATAAERIAVGRALIALEDVSDRAGVATFKKLDHASTWALAYALVDALRESKVPDGAIAEAIGDGADDNPDNHDPWTAADLAALWKLQAAADESAPRWRGSPGAIARAQGYDKLSEGERLAVLADRAEALMQQGAGAALLPSDAEQNKIQRYDAHLERALYKALHELEAMQERRNGCAAPLTRVEVHGTDDRTT